MEAAAGVADGRSGSLPMTSEPARKEWRAVSEHSIRNSGNEVTIYALLSMDGGFFFLNREVIMASVGQEELGQSEERRIYEALDMDLCSTSIPMENGILQQRLLSISRQREELQQMEIQLSAQLMARMEMIEMHNSFDAQIKEHTNAASKLKFSAEDQLQEKDQTIDELELKMEEKDRELRAIKIDNEAAWAKEDLLREQNKEFATFRRECENSEAERTQFIKEIYDLKEHIQEKERQLHDMEEQNRVAQESIIYKDERLREDQAWVARAQEMDALRSTTNHSLQAELREHMQRLHLHTIQQLQLELAEARERSGIYHDESHIERSNSKDASPFGQNQGNQLDVNEGGTLSSNSGVLPNGNMGNVPPFVSSGDASTKTNQVPGVPVAPSSLFGMGAYLPSGHVAPLHPFVMHQQGVPHSVPSTNSNVTQSQVGHFQPIPAISSHQQWQNQQAVSEGSPISNHNQYQPSIIEQNLLRSDAHYDNELSANGHVLSSEYLDAHINKGQEPSSIITTSSEEAQENLQENCSQFHDVLRLDPPEQKSETKGLDENTITANNHSQEVQGLTTELLSFVNTSLTDSPSHPVNMNEMIDSNAGAVVLPEASVSADRPSKSLMPENILEPTLLDERSLLACIVRAIPVASAGRIRISSTLPNRLGKMLAPLHWHDYKRKYGKLDDFVVGHPELFVIEGDFIQLREGAQEIISATTAVAKVAAAAAAAAAASTPHSSLFPSVAVTPVAQTHHSKKVSSIDSRHAKTISIDPATGTLADACDKHSQLSAMQNQHLNGVYFNVKGLSNVNISSKLKDLQKLNDLRSEFRPSRTSVHMDVGNGTNPDRTGLDTLQKKGPINGRHGSNFGGKQQGRTTGIVLTSRR
ncbi:hypothetical protein HHK36_000023 [Tetracentron sinense]|uniref:DUF7725 domain-containing protein n=1 Tax=Tetracentron sinense TaxID=13715 RepID=A0A834ZR77_TETSI|nr:hypothetical protein HHK36_000023 [Tetracentron sinense]